MLAWKKRLFSFTWCAEQLLVRLSAHVLQNSVAIWERACGFPRSPGASLTPNGSVCDAPRKNVTFHWISLVLLFGGGGKMLAHNAQNSYLKLRFSGSLAELWAMLLSGLVRWLRAQMVNPIPGKTEYKEKNPDDYTVVFPSLGVCQLDSGFCGSLQGHRLMRLYSVRLLTLLNTCQRGFSLVQTHFIIVNMCLCEIRGSFPMQGA